MKSDINDLCEAFLAALTNAGYAVKSIENYKQVSNRFKKFCAENGYDTYTVNNYLVERSRGINQNNKSQDHIYPFFFKILWTGGL